jgi:hypothetical protein
LPLFVVDKRKRPLMRCCDKRARLLLERGRAVVHRRHPFTIRLKDRVVGEVQPIWVNLDPGSKTKRVRGFQTGDMVRAEVPKGARKGVHVGRVAVRVTGSFTIGNADGINARYCKLLHRADGYSYAQGFLSSRATAPAGASARRFW